MKHAVLIMAHKNKEQLKRLLRSLECDEFDFFVHCDKHWKLTKEELQEIKTSAKNVYIINKRIHGELDKWSLPQISLNLMDSALEKEKCTGNAYQYFLLLSGQDYPIKSKKYIIDFLQTQYPKPLIDGEAYQPRNWVSKKFELVRWMNKIDETHKNMKPSFWRKCKVAFYMLAEKWEKTFMGSPYERLEKYRFTLYCGSAWWILPHGVMEFIVEQRKKNKGLIKELKRTRTPEETFFQIMTMNSPYAQYVIAGGEIYGDEIQKCMTYANFITPTKGFRGHPHDITVEDFDRIIEKKALFARKFNEDTDKQVLDMIDERIKE